MVSLGIDIGGTGCKCVAFRDTGEQIAMSYREYPTKPGEVNLNALTLRESVFFVIADCVKKLDDAKQVAAITVSSFGESFVPVDRSGQPLSDIILYFANTESGEFTRLVESVGAEKFMRITCVLPDASYSLAKMLYTLRTAPRPVWKFLFIASYICFCLSGETVADYSLACRSILFDVRRLCWSDELTGACGIDPDTLPAVLIRPAPQVRPELPARDAEQLLIADRHGRTHPAHVVGVLNERDVRDPRLETRPSERAPPRKVFFKDFVFHEGMVFK